MTNSIDRSSNGTPSIDAEELEALRAVAQVIECSSGEMVYTPAAEPSSVYVVETGLVRLFRLAESGGETTLGYVQDRETFGELTAFGDMPRESFAQCVQSSRVLAIPREDFEAVLARHPALIFEVARQMARRLRRMERRVESLVHRDVRTRLSEALVELAEDFGEPGEDARVIPVSLTQAELATLVGSTRQTVNACLRELEEAGAIARRGRRLQVLPQATRSSSHAAPGH